MQARITVLVAAGVFAAAALAQEPPKPPAQMAKFGAVLGHWQGSGTTVPEAGGDAVPWTAAMEVSRILDGFYVQEDLQVDVGMSTPMQMRTIYAYDTENQRYVAFNMSNAGPSHFGEFFIPERGVLMVNAAHVEDGKPVLARGIWRLGRNELTYSSQMAEGIGAMRPYVDGRFQRADEAPANAVEASFMESPVPDEMVALAKRMAGTYELAGTMTMMPGMPEMKITGLETIAPRFGGHVLWSVVTGKAEGDNHAYRAETYITWNPNDRCFDCVAFDNVGAVGKSQSRWAGADELVTSWSGLMMGQQAVSQGVVRFGEHGLAAVVMRTIVGAGAPMKSFDGRYTRRAD